MRKHTYHLCLLTAILILMAICATALCQRDTALRSLDRCKAEVERQEIVLDQWETFYQFRDEIAKMRDERVAKLDDDIRGYKALNEAMEGRIRKMAGAYHVRKMNLRERIRELEDRLRSEMLPPEIVDHPPYQEPIEPTCR